jgi:hypothetical protein
VAGKGGQTGAGARLSLASPAVANAPFIHAIPEKIGNVAKPRGLRTLALREEFSKMNCANKALLVLLVVGTLGLWGCAQGTGPGPGSARMRDLESRHAKLQEDFRGAAAARDQARKELEALEQERTALQQQLEQANKDREGLRQQVAARAGERDNLQAHLIQLGKDLHSLAGRIDAAAGTSASPPVTTAAPAPTDATQEKS